MIKPSGATQPVAIRERPNRLTMKNSRLAK